MALPARAKILARILRIGALAILSITGVLLILLFIHRGVLPAVAWIIPPLHKPFCDLAVYGVSPTREYVTFDLNAPSPWRAKWDDTCDGGHILVGPYGPSVPQPGPVILDTNGELVWMEAGWHDVINFNIQTYKGKDYLTFWTGNKHGSVGQGDMLMLDSNYNIAYRIHAVGEGNTGDLHEFRLTNNGTALITIFNATQYDLRNVGLFRSADGWLTEGMFQEVDIETNELLFEWRAIDHFDLADTYYFDPFSGFRESHPYDYYHLNSIEKDSKGNYLCSSRHYHHIIYVDGKTGDVLWALGGRSKDFQDLSEGRATEHQWQHNARWVDEEQGILSFLDNGVAGPLHTDAPYSKGTVVQLDLDNMTATHLQSYVSQGKVRAASLGNLQILPKQDHVLVGWGATAAYSEFHRDGTLLCQVHFAASSLFWFERWKSYRVYRHFGWIGEPTYPPTAKIYRGSVHVSWNGATEVKYWELQGANRGLEDDFERLDVIEKHHFEEFFVLPKKGRYARYRVAGMDAKKNVLQYSEVICLRESRTSFSGVILGICAALGALVGIWCVLRVWVQRRAQGRRSFNWRPLDLFRRGDYQYSNL